MTSHEDIKNLLELGQAVDAWGENIKDDIPKLACTALVFNALSERAFKKPDNQYTALDESAYQVLQKKGINPEQADKQLAALKKTLASRDKNIRLITTFMRAQKAKSYMPETENNEKLKKLAQQYQFKGIQKLL